MADGLLVALEGIDGAGTSTLARSLAAELGRAGHDVVSTAEPSTGAIGRLLRAALGGTPDLGEVPFALLFAADRHDHLARTLAPALARGAVVICDRYLMSSWAYQGTDVSEALLVAANAGVRRPDLTLYLRLPGAVAAARRRGRGDAEEHFDGAERQAAVAARYDRAVAAGQPLLSVAPVVAIDATATPEAVLAAALGALAPALAALPRAKPPAGAPR